MVIVGCQMKGCESRLHHVCWGEYVAMHEINPDGAELRIYRDKPEKLKKVQHSTVYQDGRIVEGLRISRGDSSWGWR